MIFNRFNGMPPSLFMLILVCTTLMIMMQSGQAVIVTCDHTTDVCDCSGASTTADDDMCEFTLNIEHLQTFTRYGINDDGFRGNGGTVWFINSTGNLEDHPSNNGSICGDISAEDPSCTQPITVDGYTFRSVITINSRFPGPTLIVDENKYVVVHVNNSLASESISIHWHGMHQRDSSWMDGVEHVTQCGILPGATFTYVFQATQSGTHWYHSHSGAQRTEGLFGTLIVNEPSNVVQNVRGIVGDFIDEAGAHSLTLLDWQYENSIDLFTQIHAGIRFYEEMRVPGPDITEIPRTFSIDESEVGPVTYWSGLVNGKGRHKTVDYIQTRLSVFTVEPNKTYRFRLIGAQSLYAYRVSIDDHKLTVIASDGAFVKPVEVDYIILHSGERYDFLLQTQDTDGAADFAIRADTLEEFYGLDDNKQPVPLGSNTAEAILHYSTSKIPSSSQYAEILSSSNRKQCTSDASPCIALNCPFENYPADYNINCTHVHNLEAMFPLGGDNLPNATPNQYRELFYNFGFEGLQSTSAINARNLKLPSTPLIFSSNPDEQCDSLNEPSSNCDSDNDVISPECVCTQVHEISSEPGSVQLVLSAVSPNSTNRRSINNARFAHPIHLHGHYFHVVDIQFGTYDESTGALTKLNEDINCTGTYLCTKPEWGIDKVDYSDRINTAPQKDTILIPFGGYAVVYFKPDNPGYWFLHCHIEVHQLEGMGVVIGESTDKATAPPGHMPRCGNFDFDVDSFMKTRAGSTGGTGRVGGTSKWFMVSSLIAVAVAVLQCIVPHV